LSETIILSNQHQQPTLNVLSAMLLRYYCDNYRSNYVQTTLKYAFRYGPEMGKNRRRIHWTSL